MSDPKHSELDELESLEKEFREKRRKLALVDAISLCVKNEITFPEWLEQALYEHLGALQQALKAPTQPVKLQGFDALEWSYPTIEDVGPRSGAKVLAGRTSGAQRRARNAARDDQIVGTYQRCALICGDRNAVSMTRREMRKIGVSLSNQRISKILRERGIR